MAAGPGEGVAAGRLRRMVRPGLVLAAVVLGACGPGGPVGEEGVARLPASYHVTVDMVPDGADDHGAQESLLTARAPFTIEIDVGDAFGEPGLATVGFNLSYPEDLITPAARTWSVNTDYYRGIDRDNGPIQAVCGMNNTRFGPGIASLGCNLIAPIAGAKDGGAVATLTFDIVPGAVGCGQLALVEFTELADVNGRMYEPVTVRGAQVRVNADTCPPAVAAPAAADQVPTTGMGPLQALTPRAGGG